MATIGTFTKSDSGTLTGTVRTLTVNAKTRFAPTVEKAKDNAPDFRVFAGPADYAESGDRRTRLCCLARNARSAGEESRRPAVAGSRPATPAKAGGAHRGA
jgi:hypothetical protein